MLPILRGLFDLSRARQALLSVAQPALGAVLALGALPDARTMLLGLLAAGCGYLAVFSLNDVLDLRSDREALRAGKADVEGFDLDTAFSRHPLAAGALTLPVAMGWVTALATVAVVAAAMLGPWCVGLFVLAAALEMLYCALRSRTWAKTFVSGVMVGAGGLAGWVAVAPLDLRAAAFFAFLAAWEIAGRNLPNDLADVEADSAVGLRTVATSLGPRASGRGIAAGALATHALVPLMFVPLGSPVAEAAAVLVTVVMMGLPGGALLHDPSPERASRYFNRASLLPVGLLVVVLAQVAGVRR